MISKNKDSKKKNESVKLESESVETYREIIDMMEQAQEYTDLYYAAGFIKNEKLRADVNELIGICEDDGDDVEVAYSVVTSDLLDPVADELNESVKLESENYEYTYTVDEILDYLINDAPFSYKDNGYDSQEEMEEDLKNEVSGIMCIKSEEPLTSIDPMSGPCFPGFKSGKVRIELTDGRAFIDHNEEGGLPLISAVELLFANEVKESKTEASEVVTTDFNVGDEVQVPYTYGTYTPNSMTTAKILEIKDGRYATIEVPSKMEVMLDQLSKWNSKTTNESTMKDVRQDSIDKGLLSESAKPVCDICGKELKDEKEVKACLCNDCINELQLTDEDLLTDDDVNFEELNESKKVTESSMSVEDRYVIKKYNEKQYGIYDAQEDKFLQKGPLYLMQDALKDYRSGAVRKTPEENAKEIVDKFKKEESENNLRNSIEEAVKQTIKDSIGYDEDIGLLDKGDFILQCYDKYREITDESSLSKEVKEEIKSYAEKQYDDMMNGKSANLEESKLQEDTNDNEEEFDEPKEAIDYLLDRVGQKLEPAQLNNILKSLFGFSRNYVGNGMIDDTDNTEGNEVTIYDDDDSYTIVYDIVDYNKGIIEITDVILS